MAGWISPFSPPPPPPYGVAALEDRRPHSRIAAAAEKKDKSFDLAHSENAVRAVLSALVYRFCFPYRLVKHFLLHVVLDTDPLLVGKISGPPPFPVLPPRALPAFPVVPHLFSFRHII